MTAPAEQKGQTPRLPSIEEMRTWGHEGVTSLPTAQWLLILDRLQERGQAALQNAYAAKELRAAALAPSREGPYRVKTWNTALGDTGDYEGHIAIVDVNDTTVCYWHDNGDDDQEVVAQNVCDALNRDAIRSLAQSAPPERMEPVAWMHKETGVLRKASAPKGADFEPHDWTPLYALAQPPEEGAK